MSFVHFAKKEITFKIVYYGPAVGGKTTNVEQIHKVILPGARGDLTVLSTQQDRTLFFDFLPLKSDIIKGFTSKFQLYTVPGQSIYNETRKLVLRGVDGIVFVADSQWSKMEENMASFENLDENLKTYSLDIDQIPVVLQFNKRDLDAVAPSHYIDFMLNRRETRMPTAEAVAVECKGVFETLNVAARSVLASFLKKHKLQASEIPDNVCV